MFHIRGYKSTDTRYFENKLVKGYDGQAAAAMLHKYNVSYNTMSAMQIKEAKLFLQHSVFEFLYNSVLELKCISVL